MRKERSASKNGSSGFNVGCTENTALGVGLPPLEAKVAPYGTHQAIVRGGRNARCQLAARDVGAIAGAHS